MKQISIVLLLLWWASGVARAAPEEVPQQLVVRVEAVQMTPAAASRLPARGRMPRAAIEKALASGEMHLIQCGDLLAVTRLDSQLVFGHKSPLVYYDPKAGQFQIQYVDTGFKLVVRIEPSGPDTFDVDIDPEVSETVQVHNAQGASALGAFPQTRVLMTRVMVAAVHLGDTVVLVDSPDVLGSHGAEQSGRSGGSLRNLLLFTLARP
jgi:hypothetical protein